MSAPTSANITEVVISWMWVAIEPGDVVNGSPVFGAVIAKLGSANDKPGAKGGDMQKAP